MKKKLKQYAAIMLAVTMSLPGTTVYGNTEEDHKALLGINSATEYQKASGSNATKIEKPDDEDDEYEEDQDQDLIDDIKFASPSDAKEEDEEVNPVDDIKGASPSDAELDEVDLEKDPDTEKKFVLYWKWNDEQDVLMDGELQLSVTEADQISFDEIISMLPESITAEVSENGEETETEISVSKWICESYQKDESGKWPTSGEFIFEAEPADEYKLDADAEALQVKVTMGEPEVMLLANETLTNVIEIYDSDGNKMDNFPLTNNVYQGSGYKIERKGDSTNSYKLTLTNMNASAIDICKGTWEVELNGNSTLTANSSFGLRMRAGTATFTGSGNLDITCPDKLAIWTWNGSINISSGNVICNGNVQISYSGSAIRITGENAKLVLNKQVDIIAGTSINLSAGVLEINGNCIVYGNGKFIVSGGTLTGTGYLPSDIRITPTISESQISKTLTVGDSVDPAQFFRVSPGMDTNNLKYSVVQDESDTGDCYIDKDTGKLIARSVGTVTVKAKISNNKFFNDAEQTVSLTINKKSLDENVVSVTAYTGTFDGSSHPAVKVEIDGEDVENLTDINVEYALNNGSEPQESDYSIEVPMVLHHYESGKKYKIRISGEKYAEYIAESG